MELSDCIAKAFEGMAEWTPERIGEALAGIPELRALVAPHVPQAAAPGYGRNIVYADERMEAIVIHLPPGAATAVHDHGASIGCAVVAEGSLTNELYTLEANRKVRLVKADAVRSGERMFSAAGVIHRIRNDSAERMVSLHVYAPPLRGITCYEI